MSREITLLAAAVSLTKTFYQDGRVDAYPMMRDFTSHVIAYETIEELLETIQVAADHGWCLLKGHLKKQLTGESRQNQHDTNRPTDWICFDYDADAGFDSIDELLYEIDPALTDCDYIFQHSASSGITGAAGIRGHVFVMLSEPVAPTLLKQWVKKINLTNDKFTRQVRLSRNAMSLCWPLDITVNQNDKLIFVARPVLEDGMVDPHPEDRFILERRTHRTFDFKVAISAEFNRSREEQLIAELRDKAGLPKAKPKITYLGDMEVLENPGARHVSGIKVCGAYTRLNLDGGDSWAYWHYTNNPDLLHNYKGEPAVRIRDALPEYFQQLQVANELETLRPFVFRDLDTDTYYNAKFDETSGRLAMCKAVSKRGTLLEFMVENGASPPKIIPTWDMVFDPTSITAVDFVNRRVNTFAPTKFVQLKADSAITPDDFPTIHRVIGHICVEDFVRDHFYQWLAHILQFRTKTQTAWLFSGIEGTGKGITFGRILRPLLGEAHTSIIGQNSLDENFNSFFETSLLTFVDEGDISSAKDAERVMAKLRTTITEEILPIRSMRRNLRTVANYTNIIVATNKSQGVRLQQSDRRWNIAPRQNSKLIIEPDEVEVLIPAELEAFAKYLHAREVRRGDSIKLIETDARENLLELSKTVADEFFEALIDGDLDFFTERLQEVAPLPDNGYVSFAKKVQEWMAIAVESPGQEVEIPIDDIVMVYQYISGNQDMNSKRFGHLIGRYPIVGGQRRINGIQRKIFKLRFHDKGYALWLQRSKQAPKHSIMKEKEVMANGK